MSEHLSTLDPFSLKVFLTVAAQRSFSQAAEQLHLTQPAVSKRISRLEQALDTMLFDRVGHNIQLSNAGRVLEEQAKNILQTIQFTQQTISNLKGEAGGPLQIATGHHIGMYRLPKVWRELQRCFPAIDLNIQFMDSEEAYHGILEGEIETAVLTLPEVPHQNIVTYPIWEDHLSIFCSKSSQLVKNTTLTLSQLGDEPVVLPNKSTFTRIKIEHFFKQHGVELAKVKTGDYLETIKILVECNMGWSVLPDIMASENLVRLPISFPVTRKLGLIHHQKRPLSIAGHKFLELLQRKTEE